MNDQPIDPAESIALACDTWFQENEAELKVYVEQGTPMALVWVTWVAATKWNRAQQERAAVQAGWQVVPVVPTKKMLVALNMNTFGFSMETADNTLRIMWAQALAAAPKGP